MFVVGTYLKTWFDEVCNKTRRFGKSSFSWRPILGGIEDWELLVYILPSQKQSIVAKYSTIPTTKDADGNVIPPTGATFAHPTRGIISEVYFDMVEGDAYQDRLLAILVFHEWMHNKLDAVPVAPVLPGGVHNLHGGKASSGMALDHNDEPNIVDKSAMVKGLASSGDNPQYLLELLRSSPNPWDKVRDDGSPKSMPRSGAA
jgi:hypothetical protein